MKAGGGGNQCICICKKRKRGVASNWWVILVCGQSITVNEDAQYLLPTSIYNLSFSQKTLAAKSARKLRFFESVEKWRPGTGGLKRKDKGGICGFISQQFVTLNLEAIFIWDFGVNRGLVDNSHF